MNDVDVIVIGAGAAGLAASRALCDEGKSIALVEARPRIGGRALTETFHGLPIDVGASFIHAEQENPWTDIAAQLGFATAIDPRRRCLYVNGRPGTAAELDLLLAERAQALEQLERVRSAGSDRSIADLLDLRGPFATEIKLAQAPWLLGTDNHEASALDFISCVSGEDRLVAQGYGPLVQAYGRGLPVYLNTPVSRLDYGGHSVIATTPRGSLRGKAAIVTLPIGVLTAEAVAFDPPLPGGMQRAIEDLPMGLLGKITLIFKGDVLGLGDFFYLHLAPESERAALYLCRPFGRPMVIAFVGGQLARELEQAGEEAAGAFALEPLRRLFGAAVDRQFLGVHHSRWGADPYAFGSYAVARTGGAGAREVLQQPLNEKLYFAGEATAADGWGATVAGAFRSGRDAATRLLTSNRL